MPIFRVKSVKIDTGQKNLHWRRQPRQRQLSGMVVGVENEHNTQGTLPDYGGNPITKKKMVNG